MVYSAGAKIIDAEELKNMIEEECGSPVIEELVFLETRATENIPGKIFPCFLEAWGTEEGEEGVSFQCCVTQFAKGEYGLLRVRIHGSEIGVSKRFWDKPPTKALRDEHPFLETGVKQ